MKCINCKRLIGDDDPRMVIPNRVRCGYKSRQPTVFWCEPCWSENIRINDRSRAESDARNAALLVKMGVQIHD